MYEQRPPENYLVHGAHVHDFLHNRSRLKVLLKTKCHKCHGSIPNNRPFMSVPEFSQILLEDCQWELVRLVSIVDDLDTKLSYSIHPTHLENMYWDRYMILECVNLIVECAENFW